MNYFLEVLKVIAALCSVHANDLSPTVENRQLKCQKELTSCALVRNQNLAKCVLERKAE